MRANPSPRTGPSGLANSTVLATLFLASLASHASASLFYSATGYPDQTVTDNHYSYASEIASGFYFSSAQPITLAQSTHVDTWNIVASTDVPNSGIFDWKNDLLDIGVWKATDTLTKEQAFDANPNAGNAIAISHVTVSSAQIWGASSISASLKNYYTILSFPAFDLPAGDYLFGVQLEFPAASWEIAESAFDFGSGVISFKNTDSGAHLFEPNTSFTGAVNGALPGTGTLAMDIGDSTVPEPASLGILALSSLVFLYRRRRMELA